jgi:uncharacterized repeat protein (TIGR03833 family)
MATKNNNPRRFAIQPGSRVDIITKADQRNGKTVQGTVKEILTNTISHPHGIKVRLTDGRVGRVHMIITESSEPDE